MPRTATEEHVRRIYRETLDDFYGVVSRRCDGDRDLTEDVVQETWLRAVRAWRADGIPERPMAWLTTVATRILSNHFRRNTPDRIDDGTGDQLAAPDAGVARNSRERRSLVDRAIARLPVLQIRLLEAFHFDRRPVADIASSLGLSERAVEGRLRRARQNLRREIERDTYADGDVT
ncbi:MAG: putative polymerase sigma factor, sigma-70 family [Gemmatimonadetes bacterium]|nr:putative polymerase sigma factor, sigma-70 family [Gemmatimonadota bacterium]